MSDFEYKKVSLLKIVPTNFAGGTEELSSANIAPKADESEEHGMIRWLRDENKRLQLENEFLKELSKKLYAQLQGAMRELQAWCGKQVLQTECAMKEMEKKYGK